MNRKWFLFLVTVLVVFSLGCDSVPTVQAEPAHSGVACNFERGMGPWHTSEPYPTLSTTNEQAYTGSHSLKVTSYLAGNQTKTGKDDPNFTHLEPKFYFDSDQNLLGQTLEVYVWIPRAYTGKGIYMRAYGTTKGSWGNQYGKVVEWTTANATGWVRVAVTFRKDTKNPDFNPEAVGGFGIRIEKYNGNTSEGPVHLYIDC